MSASKNPKAIPPALMKEALDSAHDTCTSDCIHADAVNDNYDALHVAAANAGKIGLMDGIDPIMAVLFAGIHIGYRLCQIVEGTTPVSKDKVN